MPSKISDFPIKRKENKNKTTTKQEQKKTVNYKTWHVAPCQTS